MYKGHIGIRSTVPCTHIYVAGKVYSVLIKEMSLFQG